MPKRLYDIRHPAHSVETEPGHTEIKLDSELKESKQKSGVTEHRLDVALRVIQKYSQDQVLVDKYLPVIKEGMSKLQSEYAAIRDPSSKEAVAIFNKLGLINEIVENPLNPKNKYPRREVARQIEEFIEKNVKNLEDYTKKRLVRDLKFAIPQDGFNRNNDQVFNKWVQHLREHNRGGLAEPLVVFLRKKLYPKH